MMSGGSRIEWRTIGGPLRVVEEYRYTLETENWYPVSDVIKGRNPDRDHYVQKMERIKPATGWKGKSA